MIVLVERKLVNGNYIVEGELDNKAILFRTEGQNWFFYFGDDPFAKSEGSIGGKPAPYIFEPIFRETLNYHAGESVITQEYPVGWDGNRVKGIPAGYIPGIDRCNENKVAHLYEGTLDDVGYPMCSKGWNREYEYSILRNRVGKKGVCKICLSRAKQGLHGVPLNRAEGE